MKNVTYLSYLVLIVLLSINSNEAKSQIDSLQTNEILYNMDFKFSDGVFLNFEQFKYNKPINKAQIITNIPINSFDFFEKLFENQYILLYDNLGAEVKVSVKQLWGFCNNGVVYINWNSEFNRLPIMGTLSHFVANKTVVSTSASPFYSNYRYSPYYTQPTTTTEEMRQYILNLETGKVMDFDTKGIEVALMEEPELYDKYMALNSKKKKQMKYMYLREYNKKNPLYVPVY